MIFWNFWLNVKFCSLYWAVWINSVAISSIQRAREVSLKWVKEPLDGDGDIIKDSCQLTHEQVESWETMTAPI